MLKCFLILILLSACAGSKRLSKQRVQGETVVEEETKSVVICGPTFEPAWYDIHKSKVPMLEKRGVREMERLADEAGCAEAAEQLMEIYGHGKPGVIAADSKKVAHYFYLRMLPVVAQLEDSELATRLLEVARDYYLKDSKRALDDIAWIWEKYGLGSAGHLLGHLTKDHDILERAAEKGNFHAIRRLILELRESKHKFKERHIFWIYVYNELGVCDECLDFKRIPKRSNFSEKKLDHIKDAAEAWYKKFILGKDIASLDSLNFVPRARMNPSN